MAKSLAKSNGYKTLVKKIAREGTFLNQELLDERLAASYE